MSNDSRRVFLPMLTQGTMTIDADAHVIEIVQTLSYLEVTSGTLRRSVNSTA